VQRLTSSKAELPVYTTTSLADGYYSYSIPAGTYDIEVLAEGYVSKTVSGVVAIGGATVTQDIELRLLAPCIQAIPTELDKTLLIDQSGTRTLTLVNTGTVDTDVEIIEMEQQPGQANVSIPAFAGQLPADSQVASMGPAPKVGNAPAASDARNDLGGILSGAPAFAVDLYPGGNLSIFRMLLFPALGRWLELQLESTSMRVTSWVEIPLFSMRSMMITTYMPLTQQPLQPL